MRPASLLLCFFLCTACQQREVVQKSVQRSKLSFLEGLKNRLPPQVSLARLQAMVAEGELKKASCYINGALKTALRNPALHLVNGFIYEELARCGEPSQLELAGIAYRTAHSLDPTAWAYAVVLGGFELRAKRYELAQKTLADALLLRPNDVETLYSLACASYYLKDLPVALSSIRKAVALKPGEPAMQRAAAMIYGACGLKEAAAAALQKYSTMVGSAGCQDVARVTQRLQEWAQIHSAMGVQNASAQSHTPAVPGEDPDTGPIIVNFDCFLLALIEQHTNFAGNNIVNPYNLEGASRALSVTLGGGGPIAQVGRTLNRVTNSGMPSQPVSGSWTKTFNYAVTMPAINYVLNMANTYSRSVNFLSRPTLSALIGKPALFLHSDQVIGVASGSTGSASINVDAGVKVEITPLKIAEDGLITMDIVFTGSDFNNLPDLNKPITDQVISVAKAKTATTLKAYPGQTIFVAGINADVKQSNASRVPGLGNLPFIQYFFSSANTISDRRTFIHLITPRIGGNLSKLCPKKRQLETKSVGDQLQENGLLNLADVSQRATISTLLQNLESSPMFLDFRSGDIPPPYWGYGTSSLSQKLDGLMNFLYF